MKRTLATIVGIGLSFNVSAAAPSALVESAVNVDSVMPFDFLEPGQVINLEEQGEIKLSYLDSCVTESVVGGKLTIGQNASEYDGPSIESSTADCAGTQLSLAANMAVHSGAVAMRDIDKSALEPFKMHHASPLFLLTEGGKYTLKRLDVVGERHKFNVSPNTLGQTTLDMFSYDLKLAPGGKYMISGSGRSMVFEISAQPYVSKTVPIISRLIPL